MFSSKINPESKYNFIFSEKSILVKENGSLPSSEEFREICRKYDTTAFCENDFLINAAEIQVIPENYKSILIREYFSNHNEEENFVCARAKSLLSWNRNYSFCPKCGGKLIFSEKFSAKECSGCKDIIFPRIEPCVIVLVKKDNKVLLARHTYRNQNTFVCLSGFIEAGESAQHAVLREVFEETGIKVKNIQFKGTQSWPFPDQLMLAFTAEYESGELKLQEDEIAEAKWFSCDNLPENIPQKGSVAFNLIHNLF